MLLLLLNEMRILGEFEISSFFFIVCFWCKSERIRRSGASKIFLKRIFFQVNSQTFHLQSGVVYFVCVCECGSGGGGGLDDSGNGG